MVSLQVFGDSRKYLILIVGGGQKCELRSKSTVEIKKKSYLQSDQTDSVKSVRVPLGDVFNRNYGSGGRG